MQKNVLVSIIVSIYNGEKYLRECIESILKQKYINIEIILVNDGSTDNSRNIINEYSSLDKRIVVIDKTNSGVSDSRNKALEIAKGEYLCIMDQDDILDIDYVEYFVNLTYMTEAEIVLTPTADKFFDTINIDSNSLISNEKIKVLTGEEAAIEMLYHKFIIAPWNKMIKKELIIKNNIRFNTKYFNGEGFAFSVQAFLKANKVAVGQRHVYHYRVGDPSTGASVFKEKYIHSSINAQQYIIESLDKNNKELIRAWNFSNWHTHCDALNVIVGCSAEKKYNDLYEKIKVVCMKDAFCALKAPISLQQKLRGILFKISPYLASKIINHFRIRKFKSIE